MENLSAIEKLLIAIHINDQIVDSSILLDDETKQAMKNYSRYIHQLLAQEPKMNSQGLTSLRNGLLTYWNESINPDTEKFWVEMNLKGVDYERKEPLKFVLTKNRFRRVDQGIEARKNWAELKKLASIKAKYSPPEMEKIDNIITEDEKQRFDLLAKCLRQKKIPKSQYLVFGDCMAYFSSCELFSVYFSNEEVEELYEIWENF